MNGLEGHCHEKETNFISSICHKFIANADEPVWWFERCQEITGMINLLNPVGILSVISFLVGVWFPFGKSGINKMLGAIGVIGIVISEIYKFFTWHVMTITGEISIQNSIQFAFPEFYIGFAVSLIMVVAYFVINKVIKE